MASREHPAATTEPRFRIGPMNGGWVSIYDSNGRGIGFEVARVYSLGRAEIVRDALEAAYPRVEAISEAPCGCKRYTDGTTYQCNSHRYQGCAA